VTAKTLRITLAKHADRKSQLHTDDGLANLAIGKDFASHQSVNHSADEYYKDGVGVQSAESFFALLKRAIYGNFHSVSEAHLQRYVTEAAFKFNNREALGIDDFQRAAVMLKGAVGKRLMYRPRLDQTEA
jgi:ISXO2-like transposase domain